MNKQTEITITILMLLLVIGIVIMVGISGIGAMKNQVTYIQCCGGNQCTDTYYTADDNLCHLVLCEQSAFTNKEDCTYKGANKTITLT